MIPSAIIPYIFQQLNDRELLQVSLVCRQWYQLTFDPLLGPQWQGVNFQEKVQDLMTKYVKESAIVTSRLKKEEEKVNWKRIYEKILKRGKHHLHYLKLWSSFNEKQLTIIMENPVLDQLTILDLRGTKFDILYLFKPQQNTKTEVKSISKLIQYKETENNIANNDDAKDDKKKQKETLQSDNNKNNYDENDNTNNKNDDDNNKKDIKNENKNENEKSSSSSTSSDKTNEYISLIDYFSNLKYLYIWGCKNVTEETVTKLTEAWPNLILDVKICETCQKITRKCRDQALNANPQTALQTSSQCHVCHKEHCDQCRPLWTCYVCGGDYTCEDCRAHGLKCSTCDVDFCYTCQQPKKVIECRYCHRMSCGQSTICENHLGRSHYKVCDKCDYYVCDTCQHEQERLITCSGNHCCRSYCKTCINESTTPSLISFDKSEVEQRIRDNGFGLCSYCNKLFCLHCLDNNLSFYGGNLDFPFPIVLCTDCESYYKTQLMNLFKPTLSSNNSTHSNATTTTTGRASSTYTNNLISLTTSPTLLTSNTLSMDGPIDIFNNYDQYIR